MKMQVFAIYDRISTTFAQPHCAINNNTAIRNCTDLIRRDEALKAHVSDYQLFHIAEYDDTTAEMKPCKPELIVNMIDLVNTGEPK